MGSFGKLHAGQRPTCLLDVRQDDLLGLAQQPDTAAVASQTDPEVLLSSGELSAVGVLPNTCVCTVMTSTPVHLPSCIAGASHLFPSNCHF